ncbi:TPA: Rha family transcriptional regulator, partial [Escherichia coli]|nr:DNA-binding protein [Escherichia coli]
MNTAIFNGKASMTSLEIAELVGSRHDSVKRAIERIAGR